MRRCVNTHTRTHGRTDGRAVGGLVGCSQRRKRARQIPKQTCGMPPPPPSLVRAQRTASRSEASCATNKTHTHARTRTVFLWATHIRIVVGLGDLSNSRCTSTAASYSKAEARTWRTDFPHNRSHQTRARTGQCTFVSRLDRHRGQRTRKQNAHTQTLDSENLRANHV